MRGEKRETRDDRHSSDTLGHALDLVRRLAEANVRSVQIAKDLMLASEVADFHTSRIHPAIDAVAKSEGDRLAIERALLAVTAAEQASVAERALARAWGTHLGEVHRVVEVAQELLERAGHGLEGSAYKAPPLPRY